MSMHRLPCVALMLALAWSVPGACVRADLKPRLTPAWEPFDPAEPGWQRSRKALLIADCQVHNLLSRSLPERNLSANAAAGTAIRPPQLDLFSPDVLRWITTEGADDADLILHLGDALDLACEGEFTTFLEVMESSGRPWFMAPGNHDFFYLGTYDPHDTSVWQDGCHRAGKPLEKDRFIRLYVAALVRQRGPCFDALAAALGMAGRQAESVEALAEGVPDRFEWERVAGLDGELARIAWNIDPSRPWRSHVVQAVDTMLAGGEMAGSRVVLLDSCQYQNRPHLVPNAWKSYPLHLNCGMTGEVLPDQLRTLRRWIEADPEGTRFALACHHPFDALAPRAKGSLGWLWRERRVSMLLTGHTHEGYYKYHDVGGEDAKVELNVASTTDWPMEWRVLTGYLHPERGEVYIEAKRRTLVDELRLRDGFFERGWEVPLAAPDDYRKYVQGEAAAGLLVDFYLVHHLVPYWLPQPLIWPNAAARRTEESVKDTMLWTYHRLIRLFPSDPTVATTRWPTGCTDDRAVLARIVGLAGRQALDEKIDFLVELRDFERSRAARDRGTGASLDAERARFKLSQAAWAARFESSQGRKLSVEDELIRVDASRRRPEAAGR